MRVCTAVCSSLLALLTLSPFAQATIIEDLIGDVAFAPVTVDLDRPDGALNVNGVVHVVGQHEGIAARQLIDLTTGTVGQVEFFDSLLSAQGSNDAREGRIFGVALQENGQVLYVGSSQGSVSPVQPTFWTAADQPGGGVSPLGLQTAGFFTAVSPNGVMVGTGSVGDALYSTISSLPQPLRGDDVAVDISADSRFIVGSGGAIWIANDIGGYSLFDISEFDFVASGQPPSWSAVAIDPIVGDAVFAGSFFDLQTFSEAVGFWRADGTFLGQSKENSFFRDFEVWEGQLVAAVTDAEDSYLVALTDFSWISLEEVLGYRSLLFDDGLFVGSAGFLTNGPNGVVITTRETRDPFSGGTEVPEPSTAILLAAGLALNARRSKR